MKSPLQRILSLIQHEEKRVVITLVVVTVALGAAYSLYLGDALRFPDESEYRQLAYNLIKSGRYTLDGDTPTAFRPPGYPILLALPTLLGTGVFGMRMLNFLALGLSIYLLYALLRAHVSSLAGVLSAAMVLAYPVMFYTAGTLYPQTIAGTLLLLALSLTFTRRMWPFAAAAIGVISGLLILTIPTFFATLITFAGWAGFTTVLDRRRISVIVAIAIGMVGLWTVRNALAFNRFVPLSTNSGINLLVGNSENTTPNAGVNVDLSAYTAVGGQLDEVDADAYYRAQAFSFIQEHPLRTAKRYFLKLLNYFNFRNDLWTQSEASPLRDIVMLVTYGSLLLLGAGRIALAGRYPLTESEWLFLALYLSSAMTMALFFTRIRFRLPYDFLLIGLAASTLDKLASAWTGPSESGLRPPSHPIQ